MFRVHVSDQPELDDLTLDGLRERAREHRKTAETQVTPRLAEILRRSADHLDTLAARREAGQSG